MKIVQETEVSANPNRNVKIRSEFFSPRPIIWISRLKLIKAFNWWDVKREHPFESWELSPLSENKIAF